MKEVTTVNTQKSICWRVIVVVLFIVYPEREFALLNGERGHVICIIPFPWKLHFDGRWRGRMGFS